MWSHRDSAEILDYVLARSGRVDEHLLERSQLDRTVAMPKVAAQMPEFYL